MEPPVTAALISSCVALAVAIIGVTATGIVQAKATKWAHANALDMFDRDAAERRRLWHLEHKRALYAELLGLMDKYKAESRKSDGPPGGTPVVVDALTPTQDDDRENDASIPARRDNYREEATVASLRDTLVMVQLVAPEPLYSAALKYLRAVDQDTGAAPGSPGDLQGFRARTRGFLARDAYIQAVREDLGIERLSDWRIRGKS